MLGVVWFYTWIGSEGARPGTDRRGKAGYGEEGRSTFAIAYNYRLDELPGLFRFSVNQMKLKHTTQLVLIFNYLFT